MQLVDMLYDHSLFCSANLRSSDYVTNDAKNKTVGAQVNVLIKYLTLSENTLQDKNLWLPFR